VGAQLGVIGPFGLRPALPKLLAQSIQGKKKTTSNFDGKIKINHLHIS
jgi:hypothetical protein